MKKIKINKIIFIIGVITLLHFFLVIYLIRVCQNVRENGTLVYAPIVRILSKKFGSESYCSVRINGKTIGAGRYDDYTPLGDTIAVRYIPEINTVVQERVHPNRYYFYYAFSPILLIFGLILVIESFKGRDITYYYMEAYQQQNKRQVLIRKLKTQVRNKITDLRKSIFRHN